jgi:hypothetical protein
MSAVLSLTGAKQKCPPYLRNGVFDPAMTWGVLLARRQIWISTLDQ